MLTRCLAASHSSVGMNHPTFECSLGFSLPSQATQKQKNQERKGCVRYSHRAAGFALSTTLPPRHAFWLMAGPLNPRMGTLEHREGHRARPFLGCRCDLHPLETDLLLPPDPSSLLRTALSLGWVGIICGSSEEGGWMCLYLPFLEYTAGFCLWSSLSPALLQYQKSWAVFSCHFVYRGEEKKKPKHTRERRRRLMHSEFCPEIRKPES